MNYFLTGEIQVGKSTIVNKVIAGTGARVGGFRTGFAEDRFADREKSVYMCDASEDFRPSEERAVARVAMGAAEGYAERFDALGAEFIRRGIASHSDLLVLDECGRLESEALGFQRSVLEALDSGIPVLGVIPIKRPEWTGAITEREDVRMITVTAENRDEIAERLVRVLKKQIS